MIEVFKQQFVNGLTMEDKLNCIRELLQIIILKVMYDKDIFSYTAFTGGTALRILFGLRRFSVGLDFSLIGKEKYNFVNINHVLLHGLGLYVLEAESSVKTKGVVHSILLKFPGLLKELELSAFKEQKLTIKLEIATNPPAGGRVEKTIVNIIYMFGITHFDLSSMFVTKLHACFYCKFNKGRDLYDFIWYSTKKIKPNFYLLNNAIEQTEGRNPGIDENNFKSFLLEKIDKVDIELARKDVERFLEDKSELKLFDKQIIKANIEKM